MCIHCETQEEKSNKNQASFVPRNSKRLSFFIKGPLSFSRPIVIQHVSMRDQCRSPVSINLQSKVPTAYTHACPFEFVQGAQVQQLWTGNGNGMIVFGNGLVAVIDLLQ